VHINIEIKHVNGMSKPKVTIDEGVVSYVLPFEVQLPPGDFDRIVNLFQQRVPVSLTISSPQAKMDLFTHSISDTPAASWTVEEVRTLREIAKTALRTSERAEARANESGDVGDREIAESAARTAAEAITNAAAGLGCPENALLFNLGDEMRREIFDEEKRPADDQAAEEGATLQEIEDIEGEVLGHTIEEAPDGDPEALRREIDEHVAEEEQASDDADAAQTTQDTVDDIFGNIEGKKKSRKAATKA